MYAENTDKNEIALHGTPEELAFVHDMAASISHPIAEKLRQHLEPLVRRNDKFILLIESKIELCTPCKGSGKENGCNGGMSHNLEKHKCDKCSGEGRRTKTTSIRYENIVRYLANGD